MPKKVMRYLIPADEQDIVLPLTGQIRFITHTADGIIECYAEEVEGGTTIYTALRVVDNGKQIPDYFAYLGSVVVGRNVRHVYVSVPDNEAPSWSSTFGSTVTGDWEGEQEWTPASTNDADAESAKNSDLPAWPRYDETDPGASR